ncbi:unnamed protein product [Mortierella alpina]
MPPSLPRRMEGKGNIDISTALLSFDHEKVHVQQHEDSYVFSSTSYSLEPNIGSTAGATPSEQWRDAPKRNLPPITTDFSSRRPSERTCSSPPSSVTTLSSSSISSFSITPHKDANADSTLMHVTNAMEPRLQQLRPSNDHQQNCSNQQRHSSHHGQLCTSVPLTQHTFTTALPLVDRAFCAGPLSVKAHQQWQQQRHAAHQFPQQQRRERDSEQTPGQSLPHACSMKQGCGNTSATYPFESRENEPNQSANPCITTDTSQCNAGASSISTASEVQSGPTARFEILERLGYGSSGTSVFKAKDRNDGFKTVAIKKIPLSVMSDSAPLMPVSGNAQDDIDYFVSWIVDHCCEEMDLSSDGDLAGPSCSTRGVSEVDVGSHPQRRRRSISNGLEQIVKCLGCHRNDTELWLSLEYCGGGSVADLIRLSEGPLTEPEIGWVMNQILQGLAYLHAQDHVHGDIKASNIMLTLDGHVKLGGSGAIMNHKEGAGERKRRRRSLTMLEFPASWLAPESNPGSPTSPTENETWNSRNPGIDRMSHRTPGASAAMDIWALGVACIELSQGRPPRPETPILASFGQRRLTPVNTGLISWEAAAKNVGFNAGWNYHINTSESEDFGMSEDMRQFVARCLTPDPEARPTVHELLQDPFIKDHSTVNQDLLSRIKRMVDFVDQCASITSECLPNTSLTLSPLKASHMIDLKLEEEKIGPYLIPMVRPRVDSVYDASSFFDDSGLPMPPPASSSSSIDTSSPSEC